LSAKMDDTHEPLAAVRARHQNSITSMLLDIQKHQTLQAKSYECIKHLDCLYVKPNRKRRYQETVDGMEAHEPMSQTILGRRQINVFQSTNYVAVSYTWARSQNEDSNEEGYIVESRTGGNSKTSKVRDCVFDRVIKYLDYVSLGLFWIDQESINQEDEEKKRAALEVMDLVYSLSKHSVALLSTTINSIEDLDLFIQIMRGELVKNQARPFEITPGVSQEKAWKAVQLLNTIVSDLWWTRAWTFQEENRASTKMTLMIPHNHSLETQKLHSRILLGNARGELCINSAKFRKEATKLCLAYQSQTEDQMTVCNFVLEKAGKYNVLLQEVDIEGNGIIRKSMSPSIIAEIGARNLLNPWDRLPITGNSCRYSVRLDIEALSGKGHSVSISMLALCLLNGEILNNNDRDGDETMLGENIYGFLKQQAFGRFGPPVLQELAFIKGCRFLNVRLATDGIVTSGHLWKLGAMLYHAEFSDHLPFESDAPNGLDRPVRRRLRQLAQVIKARGYAFLAERLDAFLRDDSKRAKQGLFSKQYQDLMVEQVVAAIDEGKPLRLGALAQYGRDHSPYRGIFVSERSEDGDEWEKDVPAYVFTASRPEKIVPDNRASEDMDRHVCLDVDCPDLTTRFSTGQQPRLYTKRWVNGLLFFDGCPQDDVLFPYPASLVET
jgi:hypothetical protein